MCVCVSTCVMQILFEGFIPEVREGYGPWFPADIRISRKARDLVARLLEVDVKKRYTVAQALSHPWLCGSASKRKLKWCQTLRDAIAYVVTRVLCVSHTHSHTHTHTLTH